VHPTFHYNSHHFEQCSRGIREKNKLSLICLKVFEKCIKLHVAMRILLLESYPVKLIGKYTGESGRVEK